mmetsp:Transcript_367/g.668  ORF Transcript_367/g.668 Transcript_367/m.668 type:complete len:1049 (+) Transcript_367:70-3216(+)
MDSSSEMDISLSKEEEEIDEGLYSRQLYVMGHEAQKRMARSHVLIVGMNGLGVEVAKNVVLAGVKSVTLLDDTAVSLSDLSAQFYLTDADVGQPRAKVTAPKIAELNPYVQVSVISGPLQFETIVNYSVVVLIDIPLAQQLEVSSFCHDCGVAVVVSDTRGVFANVFCDFGSDFVVSDINGEPAASSMIATITAVETSDESTSPRALVTTLEDSPHGLESGDIVVLSHVQGSGVDGINGLELEVVVKDRFSFEVSLAGVNWPLAVGAQYMRGGYVNQIKQPSLVHFSSMAATIDSPGYISSLLTKEGDRAAALHIAFRALHSFSQAHNGQLPIPGDTAHAEEVYALSVELNERIKLVEDLSQFKRVICQLALCARGQISPMCALVGGIVAQEVIKACSGKFMPIRQWFYYDAAEALPDEPLPMEEVAPIGCRYDSQIAVFGRSMQASLASLNMFLVGAGAIGCEMLKNWAMMGISAEGPGRRGVTHVTDMDSIEKSNLSRQFLFRNSDINRPKSLTAAAAAGAMNPHFNTKVYESKVAPETEALFNDDFYESLDIVCTALDNVQARLYVDRRCMFYHLPMLESGTLGTKGSTQVVVPHVTENYGASRDPVDEKSIPMCTVKFYPNLIEHTLQWARELFEEYFKQTPEDCNHYLSSSTPEEFQANYLANQQNVKLETLNRMYRALVSERPSTIEDCVAWARLLFEDLFSNRIKQLLHNFPIDKLTASGAPFWSGSKKPPTPLAFSAGDPLHMSFITATANLRAVVFGIETEYREEVFLAALDKVDVPEFSPSDGVKIPTTDEESKTVNSNLSGGLDDIDSQCGAVLSKLPPTDRGVQLKAIDFDKDVDAHMLVVAAMGNLRARNYCIPEADLHAARGIAGKIIPAIATTTALVTGIICMEIFKILQKKPIEALLNTSSNLAIPCFYCNEPQPPEIRTTVIAGKEMKWSQWDRVDIQDPNMTLSGLIEMLDREYGVTLSMLSSGMSILYSDFMNKKKMQERMNMRISEIVESVTKKSLDPGQKYIILEMITNDNETDDEVELPYLRFRLG